ncbi:GNAT family N-acetyltransferase [Bordetella genomosp. 12]|uniref:GNAT family N-acetyltransferase n=1 Tax=Bordetella genomosp. 12 TaxID=463035 RepID=A0A261VL25_9BORD|nr:GNAT family N-acetyltransferase [Bordetella genomosp. 12]OZI74769.1 GNAT family N-acetyltransferase [Bordetella genomosp. 12]
MSSLRFNHIETDAEYLASFAVMQELRPHLRDADAYRQQLRRQAGQGYRLLAAWQDDQVQGLAGYRWQENLIYGRFIYVDDLVTTSAARSHGVGAMLIEAVRQQARQQGCAHLVLDTALGNALGQRFYFRQGLLAAGMHFRQSL